MFTKVTCKVAPGFEMLENWVRNLPDFFPVNGTTIFKDRNEVKIFQVSGFELNVKAFKVPNVLNRYAYVYLRGSKAARSFQNAVRFQDAGAATPVPVAYVECLSAGRLRESYYVSMHYPTDFTLRDVLNNQVPGRANILAQWVLFTWTHLHQKGIYHLDYSPGNTLIRKEGPNYHFAVVDLNRMQFKQVGFELGIRNFRQLDTDESTLRLIAAEYAVLRGESVDKASRMLLKFDRSNKVFRRRKNNFKRKMRALLKSSSEKG